MDVSVQLLGPIFKMRQSKKNIKLMVHLICHSLLQLFEACLIVVQFIIVINIIFIFITLPLSINEFKISRA